MISKANDEKMKIYKGTRWTNGAKGSRRLLELGRNSRYEEVQEKPIDRFNFH